MINELSTIGIMGTDLRRQGESYEASVLNFDWSLKLMENKLSFTGQAANSITSDKAGYGGRFILSYRDPVWWDLSSWGSFTDKNFNVNDMGYQQRNNNWYAGLRGSIRRDYPKSIFLNQSLAIKLSLSGLGDGLITRQNIEIEQDNDLAYTFPTGVIEYGDYYIVGYSSHEADEPSIEINPLYPAIMVLTKDFEIILDGQINELFSLDADLGSGHVHPTLAIIDDRLFYTWSSQYEKDDGNNMPQVRIEEFELSFN